MIFVYTCIWCCLGLEILIDVIYKKINIYNISVILNVIREGLEGALVCHVCVGFMSFGPLT